MAKIKDMRDDQLARKLDLLLGTDSNWLNRYADWCNENDVGSEGQAYDDKHVYMFVNAQRRAG